jgi:polyferredoxin
MASVAAEPDSPVSAAQASALEARVDRMLAQTGDWLMRHQTLIRRVQWGVVVVYALLIVVPAALPMPLRTAHIWTDLTLFAQFAFWGIWWPFVLVSMVLVGRAWCGLLCPEGALSETVADHGRGLAVPRWIQWKGWPFVAFACTTVYGQMTSVYQYPGPALLVLGGSTGAAMAVGYLWGRHKRVWCRYLCPVTGVFSLLSKLAPFHFRVDTAAWNDWTKPRGTHPQQVNCAPLVPIKTMRGANLCHMCGRCSGFRGAVTLARRSPSDEIVNVAGDRPKPWDTVLIVFGLMGLAAGAFHWSGSAIYVAVKQGLAEWLVDKDLFWPLEPILPWFVLTNYPAVNDTMSPLDGVVLIGFILGFMLAVALPVCLFLAAATMAAGRWSLAGWSWARLHHFAQALIPVAGCGVFLGLSSLTVTMLRAEGLALDFIGVLRALLLAGSGIWSLWLSWRIANRYAKSVLAQVLATAFMAGAVTVGCYAWATLFWRL